MFFADYIERYSERMSYALNDIELQRIKQLRPDLSIDAVKEFDRVFLAFIGSPRYPLLKMLRIEHFFKDGLDGVLVLQEKMFGQLVDLGTFELCINESLRGEHLVRLTELLRNLSAGEAPDLEAAKEFDMELMVPPAMPEEQVNYTPRRAETESQSVRRLGSVEMERMLLAAFKRLRECGQYDKVAARDIGPYWDQKFGRALFIEEMSFRGLIENKLTNIIDKRSFTDQKAFGIVAAIDNLLREIGEPERPAPKAQGAAAPAPTARAVHWEEGKLLGENAFLRAALLQIKAQCELAQGLQAPLARIFAALPRILTQSEFALLWLEEEQLKPQDFLKGSAKQLAPARDAAAQLLAESLPNLAPPLFEHWRAALSGPGVNESSLINPYLDGVLDQRLQIVLARIVLRALGAEHPCAADIALPAFWTLTPGAFPRILENALSGLPKADRELREELGMLLPLIPFEALVPVLEKAARFDEGHKRWQAVKASRRGSK